MGADILSRFDRWLQAAGRSPATRKHYTYYVERCARECGRPVDRLTVRIAKRWLEDLLVTAALSSSTFRVAHHACQLYFEGFLGKGSVKLGPKPTAQRRRDAITVLSSRQLICLFTAIDDSRIRMLAVTMYATGLRVGEATGIHRDDLLWEQGQIRIRRQKGGGGRLVSMPTQLADRLKRHCSRWQGSPYVFSSADDPAKPVSISTVQDRVRAARRKAQLPEWLTCHTLRHCFATHQLQCGLDVRALAQLMGHQSLAPTMRYLHALDMLGGAPRAAHDLCAELDRRWRHDRRNASRGAAQ